jgi:CRP-like cAMP-binding protein
MELAVKLSKDHSNASAREKSVLAFRDVDVLRTELLRGLTPPEVDLVLRSATRRNYRAKSVIYRQKDPGQRLMLLREGRARFFYETDNGKKLILRWILPGDVLGLGGLDSQITHYLVGAEAVQDCTVFVWASPDIRALARRMAQLLENALHISTNYLSWYIAAHAALSSQTARERLAHILFVQSVSHGRKVAGGTELKATNEELADAANITPYTTSRLMSEWEKRGLIHKGRGKVTLCGPESLFCLGRSRQAG